MIRELADYFQVHVSVLDQRGRKRLLGSTRTLKLDQFDANARDADCEVMVTPLPLFRGAQQIRPTSRFGLQCPGDKPKVRTLARLILAGSPTNNQTAQERDLNRTKCRLMWKMAPPAYWIRSSRD